MGKKNTVKQPGFITVPVFIDMLWLFFKVVLNYEKVLSYDKTDVLIHKNSKLIS